MKIPEYLVIAVIIILVLSLFIFLYCLIGVLRRIFRRKQDELSNSHQARVISTGITAVVFGNTVYYVIIQPVAVAIDSIFGLILSLNEYYRDALNANDIATSAVHSVRNSFMSMITSIPLSRVLLMIAFGLIIYRLLIYCLDQVTEAPGGSTQIKNNALLYNMLVISTLFFSLFLVISVFISIPYLNEIKKPASFTRSNLDTALTAIRNDSIYVQKNLPNPLPVTTIKDSLLKDSAFAKNLSNIKSPLNESIRSRLVIIDQIYTRAKQSRTKAITEIERKVDQFRKDALSNQARMTERFKSYEQSNLVNKDQLYMDMTSIFRMEVSTFRERLGRSYSDIGDIDNENITIYSGVISDLRAFVDMNSRAADSARVVEYEPEFIHYGALSLGEGVNFNFDVSAQKRDGSEWGLFGLIARFLIKTESLDLVLLIGMLGFGLLGASFSSFQTSNPNRADDADKASLFETFKTRPIISNFWNVLARGFSAAILVYLATKGGISILTGSLSTDPNGYVLLLLCFISAVFSEKVWESVRTKYGLS